MSKVFKKRDLRALRAYVREVADQMELRDWEIDVLNQPAPDGAWGYVVCTYGRKYACISFCPGFRTRLHESDQRHTVVHELVHLHLESSVNMIRHDLDDYLGKPVDRIFWEGYKRQMEYGVDALASSLAKHMQPIKWPS